MSLINDALKKAQRQRPDAAFGDASSTTGGGGGGRVAKRGAPMAAQTIVMIVAGSVVLVVLSIVGTVLLVNGKKPTPKPAPVATAPKAAIEKIELVVPKIEVPVIPAIAPVEKPATTTAKPEPKAPAPLVAAKPSAPAIETPAPAPASKPAAPAPSVRAPVSEESVHVFLDAIRLTGVRSSGGESRVLMNEHVYRMNDIVDRSLGLRLTKVEADKLTFTDANGVVYVKNF